MQQGVLEHLEAPPPWLDHRRGYRTHAGEMPCEPHLDVREISSIVRVGGTHTQGFQLERQVSEECRSSRKRMEQSREEGADLRPWRLLVFQCDAAAIGFRRLPELHREVYLARCARLLSVPAVAPIRGTVLLVMACRTGA